MDAYPARHWSRQADGRLQCDVCPRECQLQDGQRGLCFVRQRQGDQLVLTTWGRSSGFCVDPIEKKPLNHFLPGTPVLSFGTAGCNLACRFCQNWDISKSREMDTLADAASPAQLVAAAQNLGCRSIAYTYNDPAVFMEYAIDVAVEARRAGIKNVAVTAGYMKEAARDELFAHMDAANVDLKGFSDRFYKELCAGHLQPVLDTLEYLARGGRTWLEITTLLIPGHNDDEAELEAMTGWIREHLGADVPLHFTAFHPDWRMLDTPPTPLATLRRARAIGRRAGLHHVYTGNVRDPEGAVTHCSGCRAPVIARDGYDIIQWALDDSGACQACGTRLAGVFDGPAGRWGSRRQPVRLSMV